MKDKQTKPLCEDSKWRRDALIVAIITLSAAIFGATLTYYFQTNSIQEQNKLERHNIANALYNEITQLEPIISGYNSGFKGSPDPNTTVLTMQQPVFVEHSVYYSNQKEIASFDKNLSSNLYKFYRTLGWAESNRALTAELYEKIMMYPKDTPEKQQLSMNYDIEAHTSYLASRNGMRDAGELIPIIKTELQNEINRN